MPHSLSAGILLHRRNDLHRRDPQDAIEVWIAHMGGPFWARKDVGAWSIPKGEYVDGEVPLEVALREFGEENGVPAPDAAYEPLGEFRQSSGKVITVFTAGFDGRLEWAGSNTFEREWPRGSGRLRSFPEIDRAQWFDIDVARTKLVRGQVPILAALLARLTGG